MAEKQTTDVTEGHIPNGNSDIPEDMRKELVEKHEAAKKLQEEIKAWAKSNDYLIETGIRLEERRVVIYIPCNERGKHIRSGLIAMFPDIEKKALVEDLKHGKRIRLAMHPGRTPLLFGDGSSATLGTFLSEADSEEPTPQYALGSYHGELPIKNHDVFVSIQGQNGYFRLGNVIEVIHQPSPIIDACLIKIDDHMKPLIDVSMYTTDPRPPLYLKMHAHADNLILAAGAEDGNVGMPVIKYGYETKRTIGKIVEYSRDIQENGDLLTDNIVIKDEIEGQRFSQPGDSGAIVFRAVRTVYIVNGEEANFYDALALLYMQDTETNESFAFQLPRCLKKLGDTIGTELRLASERLAPGHP